MDIQLSSETAIRFYQYIVLLLFDSRSFIVTTFIGCDLCLPMKESIPNNTFSNENESRLFAIDIIPSQAKTETFTIAYSQTT